MGATFDSRESLGKSRMHENYQGSFASKNRLIASILLDEYNEGPDYGNVVIVTGSGGDTLFGQL